MPDDQDIIGLDLDELGLAEDAFFASKLGPTFRFEPPTLDEVPLQIARRAWQNRTRAEYVGVMTMRKLHGLLVDVNAPLDVQQLALKAMLDEQRHTLVCAQAARALGAEGPVAFDLTELQQARDERPLVQQLWDMLVCILCIGETVALELITATLEDIPASPHRDLLRSVAGDEVLHARLGPALCTAAFQRDLAWLPRPPADWLHTLVDNYIAWMRKRDVVEPEERDAFHDTAHATQLRAVGICAPDAMLAAYERGLADKVPPALSFLEPR